MQANPHYRSIPIVLMSAVATASKVEGCDYAVLLEKPFDLEEILETVNKLSNKAKSTFM